MYKHKRDGVQSLIEFPKTFWDYGGDGTNVGTTEFENIAPQLQNTNDIGDQGELMVRAATGGMNIPARTRVAFAIPMAINAIEERYHFEVSGSAYSATSAATDDQFVFPFVSYHTAALSASTATVTNSVTEFRQLPGCALLSSSKIAACTINKAFMIALPDNTDWDSGHFLFGWAFENQAGGSQTVRLQGDLSVKRYTQDLKTKDPHK
jgi:hypothetical protein